MKTPSGLIMASTLYHGTTMDGVFSILSKGIRVEHGRQFGDRLNLPQPLTGQKPTIRHDFHSGFYVTSQFTHALHWAELASHRNQNLLPLLAGSTSPALYTQDDLWRETEDMLCSAVIRWTLPEGFWYDWDGLLFPFGKSPFPLWQEYVLRCRHKQPPILLPDYTYGPVAENGVLVEKDGKKPTTMKLEHLVCDQCCLHTDSMAKALDSIAGAEGGCHVWMQKDRQWTPAQQFKRPS